MLVKKIYMLIKILNRIYVHIDIYIKFADKEIEVKISTTGAQRFPYHSEPSAKQRGEFSNPTKYNITNTKYKHKNF